jgi:hypothetical protein
MRWRTAHELGAETPEQVPWVVGGMVAVGCITELDGKAKLAGKTTFLAFMVKAKLVGHTFLGYATEAGPVVWLTEEGSPTFRETLALAGLLERDDLHILTREDTFATEWPDVANEAWRYAKWVGANMLVIDTLPSFARLRGDAENDSGAAAAAMEPLQMAAADGVGVMVTRHDRRAGGEVGESGRGSTAFTGAVDIVLHIARLGGEGRENARQLDGIGRLREIPDRLVIELSGEGYRAVGTEGDLKRQEARELLLEHLPDNEEEAVTLPSLWSLGKEARSGRPAQPPGPLAGTKIAKRTFQQAAEALETEGRLAFRPINPKKHVWWSLPMPGGSVATARGVSSHSEDGPPRPSDGASVATPPSHKGVATVATQGRPATGYTEPEAPAESVSNHTASEPDEDDLASWLEGDI